MAVSLSTMAFKDLSQFVGAEPQTSDWSPVGTVGNVMVLGGAGVAVYGGLITHKPYWKTGALVALAGFLIGHLR